MGFNAVNAFIRGGGNYLSRKQIDKRVSLLCHFDGNLADSSTYNSVNATAGNPEYQDSPIASFGKRLAGFSRGASIYIPHADLSGAFTISYLSGGTRYSEDSQTILQCGIFKHYQANEVHDRTSLFISDASVLSAALQESAHYAITRDTNNMLRIFINGVLKYSGTNSSDFSPATSPITVAIGSTYYWIDELRIVSGKAVWTSNFTPPTSPYTGYEVLG